MDRYFAKDDSLRLSILTEIKRDQQLKTLALLLSYGYAVNLSFIAEYESIAIFILEHFEVLNHMLVGLCGLDLDATLLLTVVPKRLQEKINIDKAHKTWRSYHPIVSSQLFRLNRYLKHVRSYVKTNPSSICGKFVLGNLQIKRPLKILAVQSKLSWIEKKRMMATKKIIFLICGKKLTK